MDGKRSALAVVWLLGMTLAAMAADSPVMSWDRVGNDEFRAAIDKLAGSKAIDCGFLNLNQKPARDDRRRVVKCIADARRRGAAFKYGTSRVPLDSIADEIFVRTRSGQTWILVYDVLP